MFFFRKCKFIVSSLVSRKFKLTSVIHNIWQLEHVLLIKPRKETAYPKTQRLMSAIFFPKHQVWYHWNKFGSGIYYKDVVKYFKKVAKLNKLIVPKKENAMEDLQASLQVFICREIEPAMKYFWLWFDCYTSWFYSDL